MKKLRRNEIFELMSPYAYALAVTLDKDDRPNIIGLSWWMFPSLFPLKIAISVGDGRFSHASCLKHHKEFVLCFPSRDLERGASLALRYEKREGRGDGRSGSTELPGRS